MGLEENAAEILDQRTVLADRAPYVYLAMEAGYMEKVDELWDRYSLNGFSDIKVPETSIQRGRYLHLDELFFEDIIWVDEMESLLDATSHIERCKLVGVDCEWKPNYVKRQQTEQGYNFVCDIKQLAHSYEELSRFKHFEKLLDIQNIF